MNYPYMKLLGIPWEVTNGSREVNKLTRRIQDLQVKISDSSLLINESQVLVLREKLFSESEYKKIEMTEKSRQLNLVRSTNYLDSLILKKKHISKREFFSLHSLLTGSPQEKYRAQNVYLKDGHNKILSYFPHPDLVDPLMNEYWDWLYSSHYLDPLLRAIISHFLIATIHPFLDGNGRLARLMELYIYKSHSNQPIHMVHPEVLAHWNFSLYSRSIFDSINSHSILPFVLHSLEQHCLALEDSTKSLLS